LSERIWTIRLHYNCRHDLPEGQLGGIVFTHGPIFGFFTPQGQYIAPIKVKFGRVCSSLPNFTLIGSGVWVYSPQNLIFFTNINAPKYKYININAPARFLQNL